MIDKLITKIQATDAPIVVGLDPMLGYIPSHIKEAAFKEFGETLEGAAEAVAKAFTSDAADRTYLKGCMSRKKQVVPQLTDALK